MIQPRELARKSASYSRDLKLALEEHLEDNFGELLPHVFFGDVARFVVSSVTSEDPSKMAEVSALLRYLDGVYSEQAADDTGEVIFVSFVETLPFDDEGTAKLIYPLLGRALRAAVKEAF